MFVSLQNGRGLAAIAVAAFHLSETMGDPAFRGNALRPFADLVDRGYLGVDFFFVPHFVVILAVTVFVGCVANAILERPLLHRLCAQFDKPRVLKSEAKLEGL